jgi:hypothetical protein
VRGGFSGSTYIDLPRSHCDNLHLLHLGPTPSKFFVSIRHCCNMVSTWGQLWPTLQLRPNLAPTCRQLGTNFGPSWPVLGPHRPKLRMLNPTCAQTCPSCATWEHSWAQVGANWPELGPSWAQVGSCSGQGRPSLTPVGCHEPASFLTVPFTGRLGAGGTRREATRM